MRRTWIGYPVIAGFFFALVLWMTAGTSRAALTYGPPVLSMAPSDDGAGTLTVLDIGDPMPSPDVVPTSDPLGMRYTNRTLRYTADALDVGNKVTINLEVQRPYTNENVQRRRFGNGRIIGAVTLPNPARFDNVSIAGTAFFTAMGAGEIPNTRRANGSGVPSLFGMGSTGIDFGFDTPAQSGTGIIPAGAMGNLVGQVMIMFQPTNGGDVIEFSFPSSADFFAVPEPAAATLAVLAGCCLMLRRGSRSRREAL